MLNIHGKELTVPLLQGGMGVGVSLGGLAGAVAREGAMGCVSTADVGFYDPDFRKDPDGANLRKIEHEVAKAVELSEGNGLVAVNVMFATKLYGEIVRASIAAGADAVVSGAGLPMELPSLVEEGEALIAPIVSGARAAKLICKQWQRKYKRFPDFVVLEGCKAGGHLGFKREELLEDNCESIEETLPKLLEELKPFEEAKGAAIPVFCAGGIWDRADADRVMGLGASGVQLATRFIGTYECDASQEYKDKLIQAGSGDLRIIQSPVGMPGRAVNSPLLERVKENGKEPITYCYHCLKACNPSVAPYCITKALVDALKGDWENGLFFSGANVDKLTEMVHVKDIVDEFRR